MLILNGVLGKMEISISHPFKWLHVCFNGIFFLFFTVNEKHEFRTSWALQLCWPPHYTTMTDHCNKLLLTTKPVYKILHHLQEVDKKKRHRKPKHSNYTCSFIYSNDECYVELPFLEEVGPHMHVDPLTSRWVLSALNRNLKSSLGN